MIAIWLLLVRMLCDCFRPRLQLEAEIVVLRHQLNILQRQAARRPHLRWADRALFIWLYRHCPRILHVSLLKIQIGANEGGDKQRAALPILRSSTLVAMMQAADLREGDNVLAGGG